MIELKDLSIKLGDFRLSNLNLQIEAGQYVVLMGRTGQGKTTILEAICGLREIAGGQVLIRGVNVSKWSPGDRQIGYVPQDIALFPMLCVYEQLAFALRLRKWTSSTIRRRVDELADVLGLKNMLDRNINGLSGGEAQRVALGRALAFEPQVLLLDEPLSALDAETREEMRQWLGKLKENSGVSTLHVTHNHEDAESLADRCLELGQGKIGEL